MSICSCKTILMVLMILLMGISIQYFFIDDPNIDFKIKVVDTYFKIQNYLSNLGTDDFDRERHKQFSIEYEIKSTNSSFWLGYLVEEMQINSLWKEDPENEYKIPIKVIVPETKDTDNDLLPIMIHITGGGWVYYRESHVSLDLTEGKMIVVLINHRLAPEFKYPAALEDIYSVLQYITNKDNHIKNLNSPFKKGDLEKIIIFGEGTGGNLAAGVSLMVRDRKLERRSKINIARLILYYPAMLLKELDATTSRIHFKSNNSYIMTLKLLSWYQEQYIVDNSTYLEPYASPLVSSNLKMLPNTLILLATKDPLYSEGMIFANKLVESGVKVKKLEYESVHGFLLFKNLLDEADFAFYDVIQYLQSEEILVEKKVENAQIIN